ncbi:MAG: Acyl-CoA dehydrogenase [Alphaproteobacteria bacterium MarineAlpha5_Bin6]|nr:MAG: Acyl-CoA dehydrogenase [Alphaproteobacteria bacterium MarineAlpha5_Bin7]PPR53257.1 MAG: Acyl-CoA dehydrogenase [Alphaproteobacteria bacterium MarineAlpha5_Bin6]|tara:strand:- start:745 stop:1914 length:1170 start_codon:yes stop_codon:yes gene_type:complete
MQSDKLWLDPLYLEDLLSEEEKSIRKSAHDFCNKYLLPKVVKDNRDNFFDKDIYKNLGSMGFLGSTIEGYGSANINKVSYGLIAAAMEAIDSSYRSAISVQSSLVIHPIYYFGSEEQKNKYLPDLIKGKTIGCFGLTESEAGSDPSSMKTNYKEENNYYILNGTKNWITNAPIADIFIIWAIDTKKNIKGFIIEKNTEGLSTSLIKNKTSLRISQTGQIILNNVKVPKQNILQKTEGWKSVFSCLNNARYGIAWGSIGAAQTCWLIAKEYAENRIMFNKPLASKQLIQKKLAIMQTEISLGWSGCLHAGRAMDKNKDIKIAISLLKRNNCLKAIEIARESRDILGANGILEEYHVMRHLVNLETVKTYEGTEDIHSLILGKFQTNIDAF